ncbi:ATP-binding protein [Cellulophaga sp. E16_2]|uniref:ATP-binding protein n=1 Tax=Cellulophaga sp. E16_2 TaxID=2789297 RepID=UPI001A923FF2|nr:ATP-binding protein [Cellulophaga sp. E16_2]MBO0592462.1 ATP-binding protein [Cellulophaga sp. E16_2]
MQNNQPVINAPLIESVLIPLSNKFDSYKNALNNSTSLTALNNLMSFDFLKLCNQYISYATSENKEVGTDQKEMYLLHYALPESLKDLIILHRDVLVQLQVGKHKNLEQQASDKSLQTLIDESKELLTNALSYFIEDIAKEAKELNLFLATSKNIEDKTKHHLSPWEVYREQFKTLLAQFSHILNTSLKTQKNITTFNEINQHTNSVIELIIKESEVLLEVSNTAVTKIEAKEDSQDLLSWIENSLTLIAATDLNSKEEFTTNIENKINNLDSYAIPIGTNQGYLLEKKINFNKSVKKWMDYNLLPLLMDLWDGNSNLNHFIKLSLLNLKSSLKLGKENDNLIVYDIQLQSYKKIKKSLLENIETQKAIVSQIQKMLATDFLVSNCYNSDEFLEITIQNSINQYTSETNNVVAGFKSVFEQLVAKFNQSYEKVVLEDPQSKIDKASNCISQRMYKEVNADYDTLFLNKKFIGDLFLVSRTAQEDKLKDAIAQWNEGFNKSILVLGNSLSGKSTFIHHSTEVLIHQKTIKLNPNDSVTIEGRKFKTTKNLKEALDEVKRSSFTKKRILLIDDLELWRDEKNSLLNNTRALIDFIESESDNVLVIVTTNPSMSIHLDTRCNFSSVFSTHIAINKCTQEEIFKAVIIRHSATHRSVINNRNEPLTESQISANVAKLSKKLDYNIGEVLQAWTYGTTVTEDGSILYKDTYLTFPDFFTKEETIIIKYTLLYNYISEKILKEFTGNLYETNLKSSLKRLINTKVILRDEVGLLSINPVLNHDIYQILKYRDIIN